MKKQLLLVLIALFLGVNVQSQNYNFTLIDNGSYSYTVAAVPDFDSGANTPNVSSFGFTIMLQDGASIDEGTINFHHLALNAITIFSAAALNTADPGNDRSGNDVRSTSGDSFFPTHTIGQVINLVTFNVLGSPITGEIRILDNADPVALASSGAFESYMFIDPTGGTSTTNRYVGQTTPINFPFAPLSVGDVDVLGKVKIYPNPVKNEFYVKGLQEKSSLVVHDINGRLILNRNEYQGDKVDTTDLSSGVYFVKISNNGQETIRKLLKK